MELMVSLGVSAIMITGTTSLMSNLGQYQKYITLMSVLDSMAGDFEKNVRDRTSWAATVADATNADMACLRNNTICDEVTDVPLVLWGPTGEFWNGNNATGGLTIRGDDCNTFDAGAGNAACPVSYNLTYSIICQGAATQCRNPSIQVNVGMLWRPGGLRGVPAISEQKYSRLITRSAGDLHEPVNFFYEVTGEISPGIGQGGGACSIGAFAARGAPSVLRIEDEHGNYAGGVLVQGRYSCVARAAGFSVEGFQIRLTDGAVNILTSGAEGASFAALNSQSWATVSGEVIGPTAVELEQSCENALLAPARHHELGVAVQPYAEPTVVASIHCIRIH